MLNLEMIKEEVKELLTKIIEVLDDDTKNEIIQEIDNYNGILGDSRFYEMTELDEFYRDTEPLELLNRVFYGYDEDTSTNDRKTEFNPNREYFTYNGYGNLVSTDYIDYSGFIDNDDIVNNLLDDYIDVSFIDDCEDIATLVEIYNEINEDNAEEYENKLNYIMV